MMSAPIIKEHNINNNVQIIKKKEDQINFNEFEYNVMIECNKYWCNLYNINDIDADIIFSKILFTFLDNKKNNKIRAYNDNSIKEEKKNLLLRSYIKIMCRGVLIDYFRKKDGKKKPVILTDSELSSSLQNGESFLNNYTNNKDTIDEYIEKDIKNKLLYMYDTLSEKEQQLYDILSAININTQKKYTKSEACNMLQITTTEYNNYIKKLKKIICVVLNIKDDKMVYF